jgi:hypothetical protein
MRFLPPVRLMHRCFPRRYLRKGLARTRRENARQLSAAKHLTAEERYELSARLDSDLQDWSGGLREVEDRRLIAKATRMGSTATFRRMYLAMNTSSRRPAKL